MIDRGATPVGALRNLKDRSGHFNVSTDVLALLEVLRGAVARGINVRMTEPDLDRCSVLAYTLIEATSRQSIKRGGEARALAIEERVRAVTLVRFAFWEGREALEFIFAQVNVNVVAPTLVGNVGGGSEGFRSTAVVTRDRKCAVSSTPRRTPVAFAPLPKLPSSAHTTPSRAHASAWREQQRQQPHYCD